MDWNTLHQEYYYRKMLDGTYRIFVKETRLPFQIRDLGWDNITDKEEAERIVDDYTRKVCS